MQNVSENDLATWENGGGAGYDVDRAASELLTYWAAREAEHMRRVMCERAS